MDAGFAGVLALGAAFIFFVAHNTTFILVIEAVGFLVSSTVLPLYIGFLKGASRDDQDIERVMGWVIFVISGFVNVALVLILQGVAYATWYGVVFVVVGTTAGWWLGGRLCGIFRLVRDHDRRVTLAGGCILGVLFPILTFEAAIFVAMMSITSNSLGLIASYLLIAWVILIYIYYVVGTQRTWDALLRRQTTLGEFDRHGTTERVIQRLRLRENVFYNALEFAFAAVSLFTRKKSISYLAILSVVAAGSALYALIPPINWSLVYWIGVSANCMLVASLLLYATTPKSELLLGP